MCRQPPQGTLAQDFPSPVTVVRGVGRPSTSPASPASGGMAARPATGRLLRRLLLGASGLALALGAPRPAEGKPSAASRRYGNLFKQRAATTADRAELRVDAGYFIPEEDQVSRVNFAEEDLEEKTEEELHAESRAVEGRKLAIQNDDALYKAEKEKKEKLVYNCNALTYHEEEWMKPSKVLYTNPSTHDWSTDSTAGGACVNMTDPVSGRRFTCVTEALRERINHPSLFEFPGVGVSRVKTTGYTRLTPGPYVTVNVTHESLIRQTPVAQNLEIYQRVWTVDRDPKTGDVKKHVLVRNTHGKRGRLPLAYTPGRRANTDDDSPDDDPPELVADYNPFTPACVEYGVIGMVAGEIREIECPWYRGGGAKRQFYGGSDGLPPYQDLIFEITMYKIGVRLAGYFELYVGHQKDADTNNKDNPAEDF